MHNWSSLLLRRAVIALTKLFVVFFYIVGNKASLVPRLSVGGWRRAWYTLIADQPTFPRGFLSQCVTMCNNDILIVYIVC